jgi:acetyl esterase/lipase
MAALPFLEPFVLDLPQVGRRREGAIDVYEVPAARDRRPAVVFVHGGPLPPTVQPTPRDWPVFVGYASLAAANGLVGVTVDHHLHAPGDYPRAQDEVAAAVGQVRGLPDVDASAVALWFFSGGGPLSARWLAEPADWLRCIALSYPLLATPPEWGLGPSLRPIEALSSAAPPVLLTRVGREQPPIAATVAGFLEAAAARGAAVEVVDVPDGRHSFDILDHTEQSRAAVEHAMAWVRRALLRGDATQ